MSARNMAKRTAAGTLALAVCLGGGALALAGAAQADANFKFDTRFEGADRYGTAIAASKAAFPDGTKTDNVVLVNGFATVDGLTASYLAGVANAPILYVSDKGADADTKAEIKRLGAKNVWLVGGTTVIPTSVEAAIKGDGYNVTRINGSDRYETAAMVAEAGAKISGKKPAKVFIASGTSFADALAVSPIAYAKGYAIALTEKDSTSEFTKKELGNIGSDTKILVGGEAVVSEKVAKDLTVSQRVAGADRAVTANLVSDWAKASEGFSKANAALVGGTNGNGADSLVAAAPAGKAMTTLHFAGWDATNVYLKDHASELTGKGWVFGGKAAVSEGQVSDAQKAAQTVVPNQSIKVSPSDDATLVIADETGKTPTADDRVYTVSGLKDDAKYRVTLVAKDNITIKDGVVSFKALSGLAIADPGTVSANITVVNGTPTGAPSTAVRTVGGVMPTSGGINFRVDGVADETLVPVVYVDGGSDTRLELDAKGVPTEQFGLGGAINFNPAEAAVGFATVDESAAAADWLVTEVSGSTFVAAYTYINNNGTPADLTDDFNVTLTQSFTYDGNDKFSIGGSQATAAKFTEGLQKGDSIRVTDYQRDKDLVSTYNLVNAVPATPGNAAAASKSETTFTLNLSNVVDKAKVNVYYIEAAAGTPAFNADTFTAAAFAADGDTTVSGFQATIKSLKPNTRYYVYASQTTELGESVKLAQAISTDANVAPTVSSIVANDINDSVGSTSEVQVTFSEPVTIDDAKGLTFTTGGFTISAVSAKADNAAGTRYIYTLDKTLNDAPAASPVAYTGKLLAKSVTDSLGTKNVELTGATLNFSY